MRRRRGFTFVELMIAVTIVGVLASIAVPKYRSIKRKADAARVIGDFDVVRIATVNFYIDSGYYPAETPTGVMPANLDKYLPLNFTFSAPDRRLDYEHWELEPNFLAPTGTVIGIALNTTDAELGEVTLRMLGNFPTIAYGSNYALLIIM